MVSVNFLGLEDVETSFDDSKFIVIPVPYDSTVSYRSGSRNGPHKVLHASRNLELFNIELGNQPYKRGVFTLSEIEPIRGNVERTLDQIYRVTMDVVQRGKIPVLIGGEHTITIGAVRAFPQDVVVIDLDAHSDLRDTYQGDSFCHATVMRRILEQGKEIIELGVRSMSLEEFQFVNDHTIKIFYRHDIREKGLAIILKELQQLITGKKIYLSIDMDVFDPSEVPGVSTPEPDGLSFSEVNRIIRTVCTTGDVIGVDAVEVTPIPGNEITEFLTAKMVYEILGYI